MLKTPGRVGRVGSALVGRLSTAAAAAATYILRATFTRANQAVADTETIGPSGSGATYETTDGDDVGILTIADTAAGSVAVTSNKLAITTPATGSLTEGATSAAFTRAAGTVVKSNMTRASAADGTRAVYLGVMDSATLAAGNRMIQLASVRDASDTWIQHQSFSPSGTGADTFVVAAEAPTDDIEYGYAVALGGYDSAGTPDATGTYGFSSYWNDGANWRLVAASSDLNTATNYATHYVGSNGNNPVMQFDDMKIPVTTYPELFTPTGYVLDTFTDTDTTALTSHTPDTGGTWVASRGTCTIQSNKAQCATLGAGSECRQNLDIGMSDFFLQFDQQYSSFWAHQVFRWQDDNNHWLCEGDGSNWKLYDRVAGSATNRATSAGAVSTGVDHTYSFRCSGTTIECWLDGGRKMSFISSTFQTETACGFDFRNTGDTADNFLVRPLTGYNTTLDAI